MSEVAELSVIISGKEVGLRSLLRAVDSELRKAEQSSTRTGKGIGDGIGKGSEKGRQALSGLSAAELKAERDALALAQAHARGKASSGDYAGAIERLNTAMNNASAVNVRQGLAVQQQIQGYERAAEAARQSETALGRLSGAFSSVQAVAAAGFLGVGIGQVVSFGKEITDLALRTEQAKNSLQALAGGPKLYGEALAAATNQQKLFGGSLAENIEGVQGLITVARSSGVALSNLIDISQRLSVKDPSQGVAGARIALQEALTGDPTSLARRYEIPKSALKALRDESTSGSDKLAIIDKYLNQIGITSESVAGSIPKATIAFNTLNASLETLKTSAGGAIAQALAGPAQDLATVVSSLTALQAQVNTTSPAFVNFLNQVSATLQRSSMLGQIWTGLTGTLAGLRGLLEQTGLAQSQEAQSAAQAASAQAAHDATVQALARSYANGTITLEQHDAALAQLNAAAAAAASAQEGQAGATQQAGNASEKSAGQQALEGAQSQALSEEKARLEQAAAAAAATIAAGGGDIEATAARLAASSSLVDQLTAAFLRLSAAQGIAAAAAGKQRIANQKANTQDLSGSIGFNAPGRSGSSDVDSVIKQMEQNKKDTEAASAAQRAYQETVGGTSVKLQHLKEDVKAAAPGTEEYYKAADALLKFQQQQEKAAAKGSKAKQSQAEKDAKKLLKGQEDYQNKSEDAAREHEQKRADIAAEGAKKRAEAEAEYSQSQLDSRAGFYRSLADVENHAEQQRLAAQYEAARAKSDVIAQTQGADAALKYMQASEQAIKSQAELQQELDLAEKGDKKKGIKKDPQKAEYYRGLLELQKAADDERLRRIEQAGSENQAALDAQYAAEEERYRQHLDEMGIIYERKFGQSPAGLAPPPPGGTIPPAGAALQSPGATLAQTPTAPAAATPPAEQKDGAQLVTDPATQAAIDQLGSRLEGKIGEVSSAVGESNRRLGAVESAVRSIKISGPLRP